MEEGITVCLVQRALRSNYSYDALLEKLELMWRIDPLHFPVYRCPHDPPCDIAIHNRELFGLKLRLIKDLMRKARDDQRIHN